MKAPPGDRYPSPSDLQAHPRRHRSRPPPPHLRQLQAAGPRPRPDVQDGRARRRKTSPVGRVLKRFPHLHAFDDTAPNTWAPAQPIRRLGNEIGTPAYKQDVDLLTLVEIVSGIPRSFPFFNAELRLSHPLFGPDEPLGTRLHQPGIVVTTASGAARRETLLTSLVRLQADPLSPALPDLPGPVAAVLAGCGRPTRVEQLVVPGHQPDLAEAVTAITEDYRRRIDSVTREAHMPHDLACEDDQPFSRAVGPRKPALVEAFRPLGYTCRGDGWMILACFRRTPSNLVVRVGVEFGTLSDSVSAHYAVRGLGFRAALSLPLSPGAKAHATQRLVDEQRWRHIVANIAALVLHLDHTLLPAIEAITGPSPPWFRFGPTPA